MNKQPSLADAIQHAPAVFDPDAAQRFRDECKDALVNIPPHASDFLSAVASASPYLRRLFARRKSALANILAVPAETSLEAAISSCHQSEMADDANQQMKLLREAKADAALVIALADIAGAWPVMRATDGLSRFADAAVNGALLGAIKRSRLETSDGIVVLAMGKHGAFELNYSSDIDLVVLFDPERMNIDRFDAQKYAVGIARDLVNLMQMQTADGYVFRTDLRLRPDPGATAPAVSVRSAETYYESYGQNWERMAFIKARPCAGDIALGEEFLKTLRPFIWRKYLDYATIEDVHAVKRQMHSAKGGRDVAFEGHDVKLGRGGIREIEFYAQTQQLILGGKNPSLRHRATLDALSALAETGVIETDARDIMTESYLYLRHVEHRLQMINDEQTHRLPASQSDIERLSIFVGANDPTEFRQKILETFHAVEKCYDALFEDDEDPQKRLGPMVFTGVEAHPATLETLEKLGFQRAGDVSAAIRRWHTGSMRATKTERARTLLTKLVPPLLEALAKASDPDEAFFAFEKFLERLPAGVQIFSLFLNNLDVFDALIRIMTISPYLGREFSKRTNLIERLLDNRWSAPPPATSDYVTACEAMVDAAPDYEAALNAARRWVSEQQFQVTAQLAVGLIAPDIASSHFTKIADAAINALLAAAMEEMKHQHGEIDGEFVVIGLGRLGAGEMTATSDIDLMFVYDAQSEEQSNGKRPLGVVEYFSRFVRRAVTALSAATEEGALFEVDMQLRPSGKAGPAAVRFSAFHNYYRDEAWTWEAMSLVKARVIGPAGALADKVEAEIQEILARQRDEESLGIDVANMRMRLDAAKPGNSAWDVKNVVGGLTDIAFICQYLTLRHAHKVGRPPRAVRQSLQWFKEQQMLTAKDATSLLDAHSIFEAVLQVSRAATGGVYSPERAGEALRSRMASVCGEEDHLAAEKALKAHQDTVAQLFASIVGDRNMRMN
ncbi:bifunctional [glutamine synthetase] adenylyltransferase/[glutamine synthetase]-adenylyl-L-tyrosine phosphorylase [Hyphococcus sp. DH-69]|uniref:bifunctional [glutamine synthetase] adenylyltransferase/[glutamine synthetase]-adenylyl-L-tyrosine phosphorylase n=1 Tax=Hyphococcus formosus TaxID=3143534 RepID=UPI00398A7FBD